MTIARVLLNLEMGHVLDATELSSMGGFKGGSIVQPGGPLVSRSHLAEALSGACALRWE
jgi:hypothetical protein